MASRAFRPMRGLLGLGGALMTFACSNRTSFEKLPSEDTRVVVAVQFEGAVPTSVELHLRASEGELRIELEEERDLALFFLEDGQFMDPEGARLSAASWASLRASSIANPKHGCGRCMAPSESAPYSVHPGDSCLLGTDVEAALVLQSEDPRADMLVAAARAFVRLDWPGDCDCPAPNQDPIVFESCAIGAVPEAITPQYLRFDHEGGLGGLSASHILRLDPSGSRAVKLPRDLGPIQLFEPLPDGDWLLGQSTRLAMADVEELVQLYSPGLERKILRGVPHDRVRSAFAGPRGTWLLGGYVVSSLPGRFGPRIDDCSPTLRADGVTELACRLVDLPEDAPCYVESTGGSGAIEALMSSRFGELAFTGFGELYFRPPDRDDFLCVARATGPDGAWPFGSGRSTETRLGAAIVVGDRVHMSLRDGPGSALLVSAPLSPGRLDGSDGPLEWTLAAELPYSLSEALHGGFFAFTQPTEPTHAYFRFMDLEARETIHAVDDAGRLAGTWRADADETALAQLYPELAGTKLARSVVNGPGDRVALIGDDQLVHLQVGGASFSRIRAPERSLFPVDVAVTLTDGTPLVLGSTRAFSLDPGTSCESANLREWPVAYALPGRVKLAAPQPHEARRLWVHGDDWTGILDLERGGFERLIELDGVELRAITGANHTTAIAVTKNGDVLFVDTGGHQRETPAALLEPNWLDASGARGVVWLSGSSHLARIRNGPEGPLVEIDWIERAVRPVDPPETTPVPASLASIEAACPGEVALWGDDVSGREPIRRQFILRADSAGLNLEAAPLATTDGEVVPMDPLEPVFATWTRGRAVAVSRNGYVATGGTTRLALPFRAISGASGAPRVGLVVGERTSLGARVGFLRPLDP